MLSKFFTVTGWKSGRKMVSVSQVQPSVALLIRSRTKGLQLARII